MVPMVLVAVDRVGDLVSRPLRPILTVAVSMDKFCWEVGTC